MAEIKRTVEQQAFYDMVMSHLRERFPDGCDKCQPRIVTVAFSNTGNSPATGFCSACLAKYSKAGGAWADKEIIRRFVKRHGGIA